jgi:myosin-crossreactive antigen
MEVSKVCKNYFSCDDIKAAFSRQTTVGKVVLAAIKILSYCTIIIPVALGVTYTLAGRVTHSDGSSLNGAKKVADLSKMHFHIVGGGIAGLNTALLLIRKGISGRQITILESNKECGGLFYRNVSEDGTTFYAHTVRTFDEPSYQHTQDAWRQAGIWDTQHLISRNLAQPRETVPSQMRKVFFSIATKSDEELDKMSIADLLPQEILKGPAFRYFFHLTGLFEHHSALALKRYMTHTHANIPHNWFLRSAACDYESIVDPIVDYLKREGVQIETEKSVQRLEIRDNHVQAIDELQLGPDDKVIVTVGANVGRELFSDPKGTLLYDTTNPISPDAPLETSVRQPHSSVWLLAGEELASQIEARFLGAHERDFIHIDVEHPWQITLISLGDKYYKKQSKGSRLFYIAMNDLSKEGLHVKRIGTKCTEQQLAEEALKRLKIWDIIQQSPKKYTATVDSRARQFEDRDSAPIVRFMPGESQNILAFPDTQCDNLAVIGERVRAYKAPVPTTEWVTETGHRAIQYLVEGERYRMSPKEYRAQERQHSWRFVWNWIKYKINLGGPNFKSSVASRIEPRTAGLK